MNVFINRRFGVSGSCEKKEEMKARPGRPLPEIPPVRRPMGIPCDSGAGGGW